MNSILYAKKLPLYLWAKMIAIAVYIKNQITTEILKESTSYEKWYDEKASIAHLIWND